MFLPELNFQLQTIRPEYKAPFSIKPACSCLISNADRGSVQILGGDLKRSLKVVIAFSVFDVFGFL